ncbi:hypothetical protein F2P81_006735 [Scophthalmus maximus]|uniref:BTB domain-containing protein n=1 Tax=Scophthalmus maximus TaxID=52904 RepID=A0A6A4T3V5_SCOMX|nr:hypothetical protein F2P81_006735 [Scophthalmus maximus]
MQRSSTIRFLTSRRLGCDVGKRQTELKVVHLSVLSRSVSHSTIPHTNSGRFVFVLNAARFIQVLTFRRNILALKLFSVLNVAGEVQPVPVEEKSEAQFTVHRIISGADMPLGSGASEPGSRVSDPQHSQKLLRVLRTFWQEQSFHDALLVVDGEELPVQKNILAAASPYVRTKLNYNPPKEDGSMYRIELQGVSMAIMKQILEYIFSGEITLSEDTIQDMVQASDLLLMTDLKSLCCQFLESCITAENCIGIRLFSLHYCLYHVHHAATEFLQTHFREVSLVEEFRELPPERLREVLTMEKLNVGNEKQVLESVVRWFAHDPEDRRARQNFGVVELDGLIYVLGGENDVTELITMEAFDPHFNTWKMQTSMTMIRKVGSYASMNKKIYAMGGGSYGKLFDSVECFDPKTQQWTGLCPLKERRFGSVACGVGQELYVFGGVRSQEPDNPDQRQMTTCNSEFYHDEMRRWMLLDDQTLCSQTSSSFVYGAVPIGASIYLVGDLDTGTSFDYIREFRRSTGTWHRTKPMLSTDLSKTVCAALRIANCRLFRLQLSQGMFRIRV